MTELATDVHLHPWNTGFTWEAPRGPYQLVTPEEAAQFDRDGFVVLRGLLSTEDVAAVRAVTDEAEARTDAALRAREDGRESVAESGAITFTGHLVAQSDVARSFAAHPAFAGIAADLLGPDVNLYWDQAVYKKPEKPRRFPWHQDNGYTFVQPQQYLTCWVPLTEATVENGCPQVVPGLHKLGTLKHVYVDPLGYECFSDPSGVIPAPASVGDVVVFSSLTPHLTGPNTTDGVRKAYILQYAPAGSVALAGTLDADPTARTPCDDPVRQFPVVRAGRRVAPSPLT